MTLYISHAPMFYSCYAAVDLNRSVRDRLGDEEVLTIQVALRILREVEAESKTKANYILGAIAVIFVTPVLFGLTMIALNALTIPGACAIAMVGPIAIIGQKLNVFPFSLHQAYGKQAHEAWWCIYKLENKEAYKIANDTVSLDPPEALLSYS